MGRGGSGLSRAGGGGGTTQDFARFVDQKEQWKSTSTPAFKKEKEKEWAKLEKMMKKGKKK